MGKNDNFKIDMNDDIVGRAMVVHDGNINWPQKPLAVAAKPKVVTPPPEIEKINTPKNKLIPTVLFFIFMAFLLFLIGIEAPPEFLTHFTVFVLAVFIGWQVVWNVSHSLHTPLMSVTNAISGIIIIGGILHIQNNFSPSTILALIAVFVATINIVGGFFITHRMLKMFRR
jgi:NAD(P) transhydrogenase subunit alpha